MPSETSNIPNESITGGQFDNLRDAYAKQSEVFDLTNAKATESIFNKFNMFRYHKFGYGAKSNHYESGHHFDDSVSRNSRGGLPLAGSFQSNPNLRGEVGEALNVSDLTFTNFQNSDAKEINSASVLNGTYSKQVTQNPSANTLIQWANNQPADAPYGPAPFSWEDFIYCKYYGKIPNNSLVTLRRYPIPINDNLQAGTTDPLIPLAQAVTWFGEETNNPLKKILDLNWDMNWKILTADDKIVDGNEILLEEVFGAAAGLLGVGSDTAKTASNYTAGTLNGANAKTFHQIAGFDAKLYQYQKELYSDNGAYWNKVFGPVTVIRQNTIRDRGIGEGMFKSSAIELNFHYSLRSFSNINPKIALLDLISNFLSLTYNTAPFWGGAIRYFPKAGVPFQVPGTQQMNQGNYKQAAIEFFNWLKDGVSKRSDTEAGRATGGTPTAKKTVSLTESLANTVVALYLGDLQQKPLTMRSFLDGSPVGEWHVTVGNPMNPIATIGNLYVDNCKMELSDVLGLDDFPTEVTFKVTLKHGKPRDKSAIESIFNLGNGPLSHTELAPPSSQFNSKGNKIATKDNAITARTGTDRNGKEISAEQLETIRQNVVEGDRSAEAEFNQSFATKRLTRSYGGIFGENNTNLDWYYTNYVVKD